MILGILSQAGLRRTAARAEVLSVLMQSRHPLAAAAVLEQLKHTDRVTVYRTLNTLAAKGLLHRVQGDDRVWRYALHKTGKAHDHAHGDESHRHVHFECDECGSVECIEDSPVTDDLMKKLRGSTKYAVRHADVTLHGTCQDCGTSQRPAKSKRA